MGHPMAPSPTAAAAVTPARAPFLFDSARTSDRDALIRCTVTQNTRALKSGAATDGRPETLRTQGVHRQNDYGRFVASARRHPGARFATTAPSSPFRNTHDRRDDRKLPDPHGEHALWSRRV